MDASAVVELLLGGRDEALRQALGDREVTLVVPTLCDVEVLSALRRGLRLDRLSRTRAEEALADYLDLPLSRQSHEAVLAAALGLRDNFSAYDATYVALAMTLGAALLTADRRLARAVRRHLDLAVVLV